LRELAGELSSDPGRCTSDQDCAYREIADLHRLPPKLELTVSQLN
jgi:hypothetical protein